MNPHGPRTLDEDDVSDAEAPESNWLRARDSDPTAPAPSPEIARDYEEIEDLLASLPVGAPDPAWQEEVLRTASRRKVFRWTLGGALVTATAAIAAAMLLLPRTPAELEVEVLPGNTRGDSHKGARSEPREAAVGDHLVITARPQGQGDLRVYGPSGKLVAQCPGGPSCTSAAQGQYTLDVPLDAPVQYRVILVVGRSDVPAGATMDEYLDAARAANAHIISYPSIDVR